MTIDYRAFRPWSPYLDDVDLEHLTLQQVIGQAMRRFGSYVTDRPARIPPATWPQTWPRGTGFDSIPVVTSRHVPAGQVVIMSDETKRHLAERLEQPTIEVNDGIRTHRMPR